MKILLASWVANKIILFLIVIMFCVLLRISHCWQWRSTLQLESSCRYCARTKTSNRIDSVLTFACLRGFFINFSRTSRGSSYRNLSTTHSREKQNEDMKSWAQKTTQEVELGTKIFHRKFHKADAPELIAFKDKMIEARRSTSLWEPSGPQ